MTFTLSTCNKAKNRDSLLEKYSRFEKLSESVIGIYTGNLPCVDCDAISSVLEVKDDYSYKLTYMYEGKSDQEFEEKGTWTISKNNLILKGLDYKYKIENNSLLQLDLSGQKILGDVAERYLLSKIK